MRGKWMWGVTRGDRVRWGGRIGEIACEDVGEWV